MVLCVGKGAKCRFIEEKEIVDPELIYENFPEYVKDSQQLVKLPETRLGAPGVLYVNQREFAATVPEDEMTKVTLTGAEISFLKTHFSTSEQIMPRPAISFAFGIRAAEQSA